MFYHQGKKERHKVLLKTNLPILLRPNWDRRGFKPSLLISLTDEIEMEGCSFFCDSCGKVIPEEEIYCRCYQCNERFPIEESFSPNKSLGIYCEEDVKEFFEDETPVPIMEFLKKQRRR